MTKREQFFYLLRAYKRGEYSTPLFCDAYLDVIYPDQPKDEFSPEEWELIDGFSRLVSRYSPYESDHRLSPRAFVADQEIECAFESIFSQLSMD
jgi:hypothetical protein